MKTVFAAVVLSVFVAPSAFALPLDLITKRLPPPSAQVAKPSNCTDFSGNWKGKCDFQGKEGEVEMKVQQFGCDWVLMGDNLLPLFAVEVATHNDKMASTGVTYTTAWNPDGTQLKTAYTGLFRGPTGIHQFQGAVDQRIEKGQMITEINAGGIKIACVYDKQ